MSDGCTILWFRRDLRLNDNPALRAALALRNPVVPVFIWSPEEEAPWAPGSASRWWLHQSLRALSGALEARGSRLILQKGPFVKTLKRLIHAVNASHIVWNRVYDPVWTKIDAEAAAMVHREHISLETFHGSLLLEPEHFHNQQGRPFQVFTPFWRAVARTYRPVPPWTAPRKFPTPNRWPDFLPLDSFALEPRKNWAAGFHSAWTPGEQGAHKRLTAFLKKNLHLYPEGREFPGRADTSRLSAHLHFGEISPHAVWNAVSGRAAFNAHPGLMHGEEAYLRQLVWREFAHHLLFHYPHTPEAPLRTEFASFPWREHPAALTAWQKGQTGYPIVDAGMRELWATGWMHNRVRMIVGSFLVKDLLLPWQAGAQWFWDTLVDADLANNTFGWQWVAGCGADAAPYFRIFNPVLQGQKFDPEGRYVRRWIPELAKLPNTWIHHPWDAPSTVLTNAKITPGVSYPNPIVLHATARLQALAALEAVVDSRQGR